MDREYSIFQIKIRMHCSSESSFIFVFNAHKNIESLLHVLNIKWCIPVSAMMAIVKTRISQKRLYYFIGDRIVIGNVVLILCNYLCID